MTVEIIGIAVLVLGVGRLVRDPNRVLAAAERALAVVNRLRRRPLAAGADRLVRIARASCRRCGRAPATGRPPPATRC